MDTIFALVFAALIGSIVLYFVSSRLPPDESRWMFTVLFFAFLLRIGFAGLFATFPSTRMFHEDAVGYEVHGMLAALGWLGQGPPHQLPDIDRNYGYYWVCAGIYYVTDAIRVTPSLVNSLVGTLTVFMVYRLAREFFHVVVARRAALLCAFVPSMILWSSVTIKDTIMTFLIVFSLYSCVGLKRRLTPWSALGTVLPIVAVFPIRFYMIYFLGFAIGVSLLFERGARVTAGVPKQIMFALLLVGLFSMAGMRGAATDETEVFDLETANTFRQGMAVSARSGFDNNVDVSSPGKALAFMPIGITYLLLSPFPWEFTSVRALFALPEMLIWWAMIPALIRGIRHAIRVRFAATSPLLLFAATLTAAYSLVHGNVGSGFRQRAQIFVFLFIFASLGQYLKRCRQLGIDEELLLADIRSTPAAPATEEADGPEPAPDTVTA